MPLRDMMSPRRETVNGAEGFAACSPITVHLNGAMSVRGREAAFKGAMFAAYPGDVVFSKIDARNGAIGVVPDTIPKAVVTPEFPVFVPDPDVLDGRFVQRVLRTGHFLTALRAKATGTSGRKRITPEAFLDLRVPLPPIADQRKMVDAHDGLLDQAGKLTSDADKVEADALAAFEAALGYGAATALPERPIFIASFKELERWSHEAILRRSVEGDATASYPMVTLGDVVRDLENGWSPRCFERPAKNAEWGVLKVGAVSFGTYDPSQNKALPNSLKPRPRLEVKAGDVLIGRANVTRLVGAAAYVHETAANLLLCDKIFRVVFEMPTSIEPQFVAEVLKVKDVRRQIEGKLTGTSPTMKNISKPALLSLMFPLPPVTVQRDLVAALTKARAKAAEMRREAAARHVRGGNDFEAAVYGKLADAAAEVV
jgi:type I restriction enzyme S subunit